MNKILENHNEATKIADELIECIHIVDGSLSYEQVLNLALFTADRMKSIMPMYIGNLNSKWKIYDLVTEILKSKLL